jgi:2-polyprenyl-6-methoxyphenol hydroxylase-like FAD-dependent oxidoreductase
MYDVIIIGGGPAGSTLGSYLSKAGIKNLILEGHNHPRPHVGESLVLSTMRVFSELGLIDTMDRSGFPKKYGASWRDFNGKHKRYTSVNFARKALTGTTLITWTGPNLICCCSSMPRAWVLTFTRACR